MFIARTFNLKLRKFGENITCGIGTGFLEFIAAKLNQNLALVRLFISS